MPKCKPIPLSQVLIEGGGKLLVVDILRSICVEGARVDIGPVGQLQRVRLKNPQHERPGSRIRDGGNPFIRPRHQNIAVHLAPRLALAAGHRQIPAFPDAGGKQKPVVIGAGRANPTHLKE